MHLSLFEGDCITINEIDTSKYAIEKTISNCNPKDETEYIEFRDEEFYIVNDTLKHIIKKPKRCTVIRNDFLKR